MLCQKHVSRSGTSHYIPQCLWDVITCPCPWYLSMSQHFSYSVHTKHYAHRLPFCDLISVDFGHIFHIKDYFAGTGKLVLLIYKYWNWCRCIQRKDSAGVILTASWFNDINIGYRFHISTVCHSCCNNVMYFSKENLDISGSAWKKYHAGMAFLLARIVLVLKLYIQGESCVRPMQASAARLRPGSGILFMTYIDICII